MAVIGWMGRVPIPGGRMGWGSGCLGDCRVVSGGSWVILADFLGFLGPGIRVFPFVFCKFLGSNAQFIEIFT
jgi:hypothetical protein